MNQLAQVVTMKRAGKDARTSMLENAANELVFAVVGHVGSGTSEIALSLQDLLKASVTGGPAYEVEIIKATDVISAWATAQGKVIPPLGNGKKTLTTVQAFQDLGDEMRDGTGDHAAVAKRFAVSIRQMRAAKLKISAMTNEPVVPDGKPRAYILDSIRHPAEVELLRHVYQDAFFLIGVVCEESKRHQRVMGKYADAGSDRAKDFMRRDAKATEKHGQRVSDAFHLADFFVDNTANRHNDDRTPNPEWDVPEKLSRLIKIIRHTDIVRPEMSETAMVHAHGAAMRSACLSRQVGAALIDSLGNILATGSNDVPKAGGGVYGEAFPDEHNEDHRCAYRQVQGHDKPFCSNTREQNVIIKELIDSIGEIKAITDPERELLAKVFRNSRIGGLIEFSRAVHAEMDAILSATRTGASTVGARLFVTTFPCHYCARHIVAAGIDEVQYIEPYPKSQAMDLHSDSIQITAKDWQIPSKSVAVAPGAPGRKVSKVLFRPFTGVAPRLYRRAFGKDRDLKNSDTGVMDIASPGWGSPWHLRKASYAQLEAELEYEDSK